MADEGQRSPSAKPLYSEKQLASLRQTFAAFDRDGSGTIDAAELKQCLKSMGQHPDPVELEELLKQMDTDGTYSNLFVCFPSSSISFSIILA